MAFCKNCGSELPENATVCPNCNAPVEQQSSAFNTVNQVFANAPDYTAQFTQEDIAANKVFAILAYFGILFLVPLLAAKESKFARFHANQGLIMFIASFALGVIAAIPVVGWIVGGIGEIVLLVFAIMGIINAAKGEAKELPIIGKFKIIQ